MLRLPVALLFAVAVTGCAVAASADTTSAASASVSTIAATSVPPATGSAETVTTADDGALSTHQAPYQITVISVMPAARHGAVFATTVARDTDAGQAGLLGSSEEPTDRARGWHSAQPSFLVEGAMGVVAAAPQSSCYLSAVTVTDASGNVVADLSPCSYPPGSSANWTYLATPAVEATLTPEGDGWRLVGRAGHLGALVDKSDGLVAQEIVKPWPFSVHLPAHGGAVSVWPERVVLWDGVPPIPQAR